MTVFPRMAMQSGAMDDTKPLPQPDAMDKKCHGVGAWKESFYTVALHALHNRHRDAGEVYF